RIARENDGAAAILDAITIGRLNDIAMIDLEGDHAHTILFVDRTVGVELVYCNGDSGRRKFLVGDSDLNVRRIRPLKVRHQFLRPRWADNSERRATRAEV